MLTRQQLVAAGLADNEESAPQDFGGRVLPNPAHIRASWDTDGPPITRLPNGVTFKKDNWRGSMPLDVSNPNPADVIPPAMGTEIQAKTTGKPIDFSQYAQAPAQIDFGKYENTPTRKDAWGTPSAEIDKFLENNSGYQFLDADPQFPNRKPGIYPTGPGNEWRNDPKLNAKKGNPDQSPVDIHLLKHSYENAKQAAGAATAPMLFEATIPQIIGGVAGGAAGSAGASQTAKALGAGETGQEVAGDVGGLAGGIAGGAAADWTVAKATALYKALPKELQSELLEVLSPRIKHALNISEGVKKLATPVEPTPVPEPKPTPEVLQAAPLAQGAKPYTDPAQGLGQIPLSRLMEPPATPTPGALDKAVIQSVTGPKTVNDLMGGGVPRTLSGDSALRQILTGQDNANLMKIARSRGINVSQEAQLKPSVADSRLVNKIIDDFSPDELAELRDQYLENTRMGKHNFGDIGPEAWKTMSLQSYFPEVKIPAAQMLRTRTAITNAPLKNVQPEMAPVTDLAQQIKATGKVTPKAKPAAGPAGAGTGLESQLNQMLDQVKQGKTLKDLMGVSTTIDPAELSKRWGVDEESLAAGREQTRGMNPNETEESIQDLVAKYKKKGAKVDPVIETRDAQNNIVSVDGRARVIAAQRAGLKRIPVIVRRAAAPTQ